MKIKILFCLLLLKSSFGIAQNDSTAYQKFYSEFVGFYKEVSKPPLKNYYDVLSTAARFNFNPYNPLFAKALASIAETNKVDEQQALDILFEKVFVEIKKEDLWINAPDIYKNKRNLFELYNNALCACYTSRIKKNNTVQDLLTATKECGYELSKDSSFLNTFKRSGGNNVMSDFIKLQQYFSMYNYAHCEILNYKQNESIKYSAVYEQYFTGISFYKAKEGENVMRFFKDKQWDSLAIIFPGYKKFLPELNRTLVKLKTVKGIAFSNFITPGKGEVPKIVVSYFKDKKEIISGEVVMVTSAYSLNSTIISIRFNEFKPGKKVYDEEIIMKPVEN